METGYESPTKGLQAVMQRLSSPSKAAAMNYIVVHQLQVVHVHTLRELPSVRARGSECTKCEGY